MREVIAQRSGRCQMIKKVFHSVESGGANPSVSIAEAFGLPRLQFELGCFRLSTLSLGLPAPSVM